MDLQAYSQFYFGIIFYKFNQATDGTIVIATPIYITTVPVITNVLAMFWLWLPKSMDTAFALSTDINMSVNSTSTLLWNSPLANCVNAPQEPPGIDEHNTQFSLWWDCEKIEV